MEMSGGMEKRQASATLASLTMMFCSQPGIYDAFRAWAIARAEEMSTPEMAMWLADLRPAFLVALGEDMAVLLQELNAQRRKGT